jgi:hypothetical protein
MWNRSCIDSIDDYKSAVYLSIYRGGGLDPLQTNFRAYPKIFTIKHSKKLRTLICYAPTRTVRSIDADCPDRGPSAHSKWCSTMTIPYSTLAWRRNEEGWTPAVPLDLPSDTVVSPSMSIGTCTVQNSKRRRNHSRNLTLQLRCHAYHIYCLAGQERGAGVWSPWQACCFARFGLYELHLHALDSPISIYIYAIYPYHPS